jgi:acetyl-CoA carboxylase biotin carboxyl carrier protein
MDLEEIRALIEAFGASGLAEMRLTRGDWTLHLVRSAEATAAAPAPAAGAHGRPEALRPKPTAPAAETGVRAPLSGLVYLSRTPGAPDFVAVGRRVEAGDVVAVIEAMKVFNEIPAEVAGQVAAVLVENGAPVEFGQPLFKVNVRK